MCIVSAILFFLLSEPTKAHALNPAPDASSRITIASLVAVLKSRAIIPVIIVCLGASVFAGLNNFQTVFADDRGLNYAIFFLIYTLTVIIFRLVLVKFKGGTNPYLMIVALQYVMCASVVLLMCVVSLLVLLSFVLGSYRECHPVLNVSERLPVRLV